MPGTGGGTTIFGATPNALAINGSSARSISVNESNNDPNAITALSFTIKDSIGNIITNFAGSGVPRPLVGFSLIPATGLGGGESLTPAIDSASNSGIVSTVFHAGTKSGIVRVAATLLGTSRPPAYVDVTVSGGYPDSNHISLTLPQVNYPGSLASGPLGVVSVQMGDQFNNPVRTGTPMYFTTTGGAIDPAGQTSSTGQASVTLYGGGQSPNDGGHAGYGTVKMTTYGIDSTRIVKTASFIFSGVPNITVTSTNLGTINSGNSLQVNYTVADANGNPLANGNSISVTAGGTAGASAQLSGATSVATTDSKDTNTTKHQFTITNNVAQGGAGGTFTITITVNGSNGTATKILTGTLTAPQSSTRSTVSGTVNYNGQGVPGIKVADKNSVTQLATYTDATGSYSLTYQLTSSYSPLLVFTDSTGTYNIDTVSSVTLSPGTSQTVSVTLTKATNKIRTANQVSTMSISTNHIYSKGVGVLEGNNQLENCKILLQVKDSAGVPIAATPSYKATFTTKFYPAIGAYGTPPSVNPDSEWTDENGQLPITIASGTCPGTVQLIVTVDLGNGNTFQTYITRLDIWSGFADQSHFTLAPNASEGNYPNGWVLPYWGVYQTHNYVATVADTFGYAVPSGHAVGFIATPGGDGIIGNNGISTTDQNGSAGVAWITWPPTPSDAGHYTTSDPATGGRKGYMWLQSQTMGKNGTYIKDSILILWNDGAANFNQPANITMTHGTSSGLVDTLKLYDSNLNPINASITASVNLGSNPTQGESFMVYGDISSDPTTPPLITPAGDYRLLGRGNTYFLFGITDQSTINTAGTSVIINIYITIANHAPIHVQVPVTVN